MKDCTIACQLLTWGKKNENEAENTRTGIRTVKKKSIT